MGYTRHHAIVVTSSSDEIEEARAEAARIFPWVSPLSPKGVNFGRSFFIPPDDSKEGWDESIKGDTRRDQFIAWLESQRYEDGSSSLAWVEVAFGEDEGVREKALRGTNIGRSR